jgi:hypothetical protein
MSCYLQTFNSGNSGQFFKIRESGLSLPWPPLNRLLAGSGTALRRAFYQYFSAVFHWARGFIAGVVILAPHSAICFVF